MLGMMATLFFVIDRITSGFELIGGGGGLRISSWSQEPKKARLYRDKIN